MAKAKKNDLTYEFDGKVYIQQKLVWGQVEQIQKIIEGVKLPARLTVESIIKVLGEKLPQVLAVILTEKGKSPKDKDIDAIGEHFRFAVPLDIIERAVSDFFELNPISSLLEKIGGLIDGIQGQAEKMLAEKAKEAEKSGKKTPSKPASPSSAGGISQKGTQ